MAKNLCIICRERPAQVPDRNRPGRPIKRVCRECHFNRLAGDFKRIVSKQPFAAPIADIEGFKADLKNLANDARHLSEDWE